MGKEEGKIDGERKRERERGRKRARETEKERQVVRNREGKKRETEGGKVWKMEDQK